MSFGSAFLLIWVIIYFPFSTACLQDEKSYLLDLKAALNLSMSSGSLSSSRGLKYCEWEGVGCDYHTSHVIRLEFDYWYTQQAELHPSLFNLQHLQHLDLSGNDFRGISIPRQLSKLKSLTFLNLSYAGFGGEVPLELGNMSSLRHLDISENYYEIKISDTEWQTISLKSSKFDALVRNLRSLRFLQMKGVNLKMATEHWGGALSDLANLIQIHLSYCGLSGKIPDL
ncbi:hypothetical protein SUGI_0878060 [Cryptomeria japonica]|nr:hypothetical protein SUGI_0878060 [Cryptomeria japonica]